MWSELKTEVLSIRRKFFIEVVQAPLVSKILKLGNKYPLPTHENVSKKNSHTLIDIYAEFNKFNTARITLFRVLFRMFIAKYEVDDVYAERFDWLLRKLLRIALQNEWEWPTVFSPTTHWEDPEAKIDLAKARLRAIQAGG